MRNWVHLKAGLDVEVTSKRGHFATAFCNRIPIADMLSSQSQLTEMSLVIIAMSSVNANFGAEIPSGK